MAATWSGTRRTLATGDSLGDSGNFGTLDQLEALRFVNGNARVFGGAPGNVTVMGESAGAVNVWALMVSPLSKGLMDKAIPLSGGLQAGNPAAARTYAEAFLTEAVGPVGDHADAVRRLRSMPADDLIRAQVRRGAVVGDPPKVIADGTVLPADYHAAIAAGEYRDVPVLAGNTFEEGKLFGATIGAYRPRTSWPSPIIRPGWSCCPATWSSPPAAGRRWMSSSPPPRR